MLKDPDFSTFVLITAKLMQYLAVSLSSLGNRKRGRRRRLPERRSKIDIHAIEIIKVFQGVNDAIFVQKIKLE